MDEMIMKERFEDTMRDVAQYAIENGCVDGDALGIAKLVAAKGYGALSRAQQEFFEVVRQNTKPKCAECREVIPEDELYLGGDYCDEHHHMYEVMNKDD